MDRVFGGLGTDIVSVNITGMGVSGTAMSGGLHFEDTETIRFINTGTAVVDASMMDGNIIMYTGSAPGATTIHGLAGNFDGGTFGGDVTIYADPSAGNATYSNFGAGTQILYGSQAQGVATTFTMGGNLDDTDFIQGWDFDTVTRDALSATFSGGSFAPQIQGVEDLAFAVSGGNTIDAANIVGAVNWALTGTQALTLNGGAGTPINGANGMIINAGGLSGLFTLDASNTAETITLGSGGSLVNAWGGNDSVTGGSGADTVNGGDGDDTIQGGGAADVLNGDAGNDTFKLGQATGLDNANDTVDGGAGTHDLLDYNGSTAITVIFTGAYSGTVTGTGLGTDSFSGIKQIIGSTGNDTITGFHGYTLTNTSADLSRIYIGNLGNDTIDGGGSENGYFDIAAYDPAAPIGVFVNLGTAGVTVKGQTVATAGTATDITGGSSVGIDTLINIDGVIGTNAADILIGGSDSRGYNGVLFEHLNGFAGNDIIAGNAAALSPTLSPGGTGIVNLLDQGQGYLRSVNQRRARTLGPWHRAGRPRRQRPAVRHHPCARLGLQRHADRAAMSRTTTSNPSKGAGATTTSTAAPASTRPATRVPPARSTPTSPPASSRTATAVPTCCLASSASAVPSSTTSWSVPVATTLSSDLRAMTRSTAAPASTGSSTATTSTVPARASA
jgi:hypothetical protein